MSETEAPLKAASKTALKKANRFEGVTLPSGTVVTVTLPNIELMIKAGTVPNDLIQMAVETTNAAPKTVEETKKLVTENWEWTEFIVPHVLVEPEIAKEDVADMDPRDIQMLADFAARRDDTDAVGHQLGGLETVKSFREARGIPDFDALLEGSA